MRRFLRNRDGVSTVEFAVMAPVFFTLFFAAVELGYFYFSKNSVAGGLKQASLLIRTGQINTIPEAQREQTFKQAICANATLLQCGARLRVNVEVAQNFGSVGSALDGVALSAAALQFDAGVASSVIMAEAIYEIPSALGAVALADWRDSGGAHFATSRIYFRNEPY